MPTFLKDHKKIIGCDLDDVLANFIKSFMAIAKAKHRIDPNILPTTWEWDGTYYLDGTPVAKEDMTRIVDSVWGDIIAQVNFWTTLDVMPHVDPDRVRALNENTKLYFPTARAVTVGGYDVGAQSASWINRKFGIRYPTVFVSNEKGPLAAALKYDYFIDDRPINCEAIKTAAPNCKVFLMNASHNQTFNKPEFPRVQSFNEFADIVSREG